MFLMALRLNRLCLPVFLGLLAVTVRADVSLSEQLTSAVSDSSIALDLRYRYEMVDEDGFDDPAKASLLRSRVTFESGKVGRLSALLQIDDVRSLGSEDYNSTENGKVQYPTIADPEGTEFNQAWLRYSADDLKATLGRQRILLDRGRFIGAKPWRQNAQTYDALRLQWDASADFSIDASYVTQVSRVFGPADGSNPADWHGDSTFVRMSYDFADGHELVGFAYLLDVAAQSDFSAAKTVNNSSNTFGVAYSGVFSGLNILARLATQEDSGASELDYRAPYYIIEMAAPLGDMALKAAYEVLGADNGVGFGTRLANGHGHQGWADKFLATPGDGIKDAWVSLAGNLGPLALTARYHDFRAESSSVNFGSEIDLQAQWQINAWLTATAKAAVFETEAPDRYPDTKKAWLALQIRL
ncbi:alginate export family protein [Congregibacter variabilis]|uniref:Alginate export family protein n=1 Tax=Congregibacter variabilis TaxID=3081200 RepID=A0ABZ0I5U7_9GAMM|nr:alginate export family protein [Congregibacter sp. IMCC43200]